MSPNFIFSVFPSVATCFILEVDTVNTAISAYVSPPSILVSAEVPSLKITLAESPPDTT